MKEFFKKYFSKKVIFTYLYGAFASRFLGFVVGMWAVTLVGYFFEFPSFKNLWGINSHKTLVSKETFENLKWIAQVLIGFFVFEIFHKTLFSKVSEKAPEYYKKTKEYMEENGHLTRIRRIKTISEDQVKRNTLLTKTKAKELLNRFSKM
jgi:hypothetical protein